MATIDQFSVSAIPIEMRFDEEPLAVGTAFIWQAGSNHFLITNWHNVAGKDPHTGAHLSRTAAEPNHLQVWFNLKGQLGNKVGIRVDLRSADGTPLWFVHPRLGQRIDAVAVPISGWDNVELYPINTMPLMNDLSLEVGTDVFILGFPFGLGPVGLPVWKRGSVASEPEVLDPGSPVILVDTASRPGMSGSPVIRRSWGAHPMGGGGITIGGNTATRLVGIYSGRLAANDPNDAQLGMVWAISLVEEIVAGESLDS